MTTVTICKSETGSYTGINVNGHAAYAAAGSDIVCAAVSTLTINTINSIDQFTRDTVTVRQDEDQIVIEAEFNGKEGDLSPEATLLLQSYEMGVRELAKQYREVQVLIKERG